MKTIYWLCFLLVPLVGTSQAPESLSADARSIDRENAGIIAADGDFIVRATISEADSNLEIQSRLGPGYQDYRIFGYEKPDSNSRRMILISIFTKDVEGNPFDCPFGAYYDTYALKTTQQMELKYLSTEGAFIKAAIVKNDQQLQEVYIARKWIFTYIDPTGTYKWKYRKGELNGDPGYVQVKAVNKTTVFVNLYVGKGAPSYNSGSAFDTLGYYQNQAVFHTKFDASCQIRFRFTDKGVYVNEQADNYNFGCGFGNAVVARGYFEKISSAPPRFKNYSTGEPLNLPH